MRVIRPKAAILEDRRPRGFRAQPAGLRSGGGDLPRICRRPRTLSRLGRGRTRRRRRPTEDRRPRPGQLSPAPHPDRKAPGRQRQPQSPGAPEILRLGRAQKAGPPQSRRPPCASCAARSAGSPGGFAKKKFRGCCGPPARAATGWRAATTPSFNCCCKPACAWAKLRAWRSPIAKSTPAREWSSCAPEKAGRSAKFP